LKKNPFQEGGDDGRPLSKDQQLKSWPREFMKIGTQLTSTGDRVD